MWVGDMSLDAAHDQRSRQRAAPAILDHVAQAIDRRRFADHAVVEGLTGVAQAIDDAHRAIGGGTFLVRRDQQRDGADWACVDGDERFDSHHECGDRRLHVGGAAPVQEAVAERRHERIGTPRLDRAGGYDVGMAGEAHHRTDVTTPCPEVGDAVGCDAVEDETQRRQTRHEHLLAAGIVRCLRAARDQLARKIQRWRGRCALALRATTRHEGCHCGRLRKSGSISSLTKSFDARRPPSSSSPAESTRVEGVF